MNKTNPELALDFEVIICTKYCPINKLKPT